MLVVMVVIGTFYPDEGGEREHREPYDVDGPEAVYLLLHEGKPYVADKADGKTRYSQGLENVQLEIFEFIQHSSVYQVS